MSTPNALRNSSGWTDSVHPIGLLPASKLKQQDTNNLVDAINTFYTSAMDQFTDFFFAAMPNDWKDGIDEHHIEGGPWQQLDAIANTSTTLCVVDTRSENPLWAWTIKRIMEDYISNWALLDIILSKDLLYKALNETLINLFEKYPSWQNRKKKDRYFVRVIANKEPSDSYNLPDQVYISRSDLKLFKVWTDRGWFASFVRNIF